MKTLADAFEHTLYDVYYAENAILKSGPKVQSAVGSDELKKVIGDHLKQTEGHVRMLEDVFKTIKVAPKGERCDATEGIIKEAEGIMKEASGDALDAMLIGILQAIEHYEIARYGTLREWAEEMGNKEAVDIIARILDQEKAANNKLTGVAVNKVNKA